MNETTELEEYDDNFQATGVEAEQLGEDEEEFEDIEEPWDPEKIRVSTKAFSLRNILDLIEEGSLELAPDFQRLEVWKPRQKTRLIESILLQIPLPAFYFAEDSNGMMRVVDGLQRLSTVCQFVRGKQDQQESFRLHDLEYINDAEGQYFSDLPAPWQRRINNTQIQVHVIDPTTPQSVMYDIFKRINTGGTPLNAQEIRHCMSKPRSRLFLKRCVDSPEFFSATRNIFERQKRMIDREVVLRFIAFSLLRTIDEYSEYGSMERLLWKTTERLDNHSDLSDNHLMELSKRLAKGLELSECIFGENAFRKWKNDSTRLSPFNRALFETWTYGLSLYPKEEAIEYAETIATAAREKMSTDGEYISSITVSTGNVDKVKKRFNVVKEILEEIR